MTSSSSPLGNINAARRPGAARGSQLPHDVQARMKAFQLSRQGPPPPQVGNGPFVANERSLSSSQLPSDPSPAQPQPQTLSRGPSLVTTAGTPGAGAGPTASSPVNRPMAPNFNSTPNIPNLNLNPKMGLAAKRGLNMGMKLSDATGPVAPSADRPKAPQPKEVAETPSTGNNASSLFNKYSEYVDTNTGTLNFKGKATIHGQGIDFSGGGSFSMSLDEVDTLDELGKGNYGTVYKVRHSRPKIRKPGQGLRGNRVPTTLAASGLGADETACEATLAPAMNGQTTGIVMAMKEIRLELDEAKFAAIIMELDILHRCVSPFIVDFYGAFFQEGAVYICMEFMDGGSIDKLYGNGVPEAVLRKITLATIMGLKSLKEEHNIIHRDVKPTNILVNTKGQVKICDFGVSGNLVASIAKTNIGCQSYMAPERISGGGIAQAGANPGGGTYSVQSDIWSLGLTIIECGMGRYPYPPETYDNIFSQLSVGLIIPMSIDYKLKPNRTSSRGILQTCPPTGFLSQQETLSAERLTRFPNCARHMQCSYAIPGSRRC